MQALYFLGSDDRVKRSIKIHLDELELPTWQLNIYSRDGTHIVCEQAGKTRFRRRHSNEATERAVRIGLSAAVAAALAAAGFLPLLVKLGTVGFCALIFITAMIAAWAARIFDKDSPHTRISPFAKELGTGNYVLEITVQAEHRSIVEEAMAHYGEVRPLSPDAPGASVQSASESAAETTS